MAEGEGAGVTVVVVAAGAVAVGVGVLSEPPPHDQAAVITIAGPSTDRPAQYRILRIVALQKDIDGMLGRCDIGSKGQPDRD